MENRQSQEQPGHLIQRLQAGDPSAVRELVHHYGPKLHGFLRCLVHSHEIAEDLTQETLITAYQKCGQVRATEKFDTWLFTLARNLAYKEMNRKSHKMETSLDMSWFDSIQDRNSNHPLRHLTAEEAAQLLSTALATLDAKRREIMALRYYSDLSLQEIAGMMNLPLGSIGTTIVRSLATLKKFFESKGLKVEDLL